jgi:hypothetical protein
MQRGFWQVRYRFVCASAAWAPAGTLGLGAASASASAKASALSTVAKEPYHKHITPTATHIHPQKRLPHILSGCLTAVITGTRRSKVPVTAAWRRLTYSSSFSQPGDNGQPHNFLATHYSVQICSSHALVRTFALQASDVQAFLLWLYLRTLVVSDCHCQISQQKIPSLARCRMALGGGKNPKPASQLPLPSSKT